MTPVRAAALLPLLVLAGCGGGAAVGDGRTAGAPPAAGDGEPAAPAPPVASGGESRGEAEPLPAEDTSRPLAEVIEGETLDGSFVSLADLRGRPVFVKFFAFH